MTTPAEARAIAGALFDFLGYLTTRDKETSFGATAWAAPAVDLLADWAKTRNLSLADPDIQGWNLVRVDRPAPVICGNCDTALPEGCGGLFRDDGPSCRLNHTEPAA